MAKVIALIFIFVLLVTFIIGMWVISGKFIEAAEQISKSSEANAKSSEANAKTMELVDGILQREEILGKNGGSGLIPAT
jgi:hypothetical protein